MKKFLIITGGSVDISWASQYIENNKYDFCIAADSGLVHAAKLGVKVDYILGDYDSVDKNVLEEYREYRKETEIETFPREKDYTDTHLAIMTAINNKATDIDILGATGTRMDHTFTNVGNLKAAYDAGINCQIVDNHNKIYILGEKTGSYKIRKDRQFGHFISLVPLTSSINVTLEGTKYLLHNKEVVQGVSLCQSNEIKEEEAVITVNSGIAIVFETKD